MTLRNILQIVVKLAERDRCGCCVWSWFSLKCLSGNESEVFSDGVEIGRSDSGTGRRLLESVKNAECLGGGSELTAGKSVLTATKFLFELSGKARNTLRVKRQPSIAGQLEQEDRKSTRLNSSH